MTKEDRDQLLKYLHVSSPYGREDKELLYKDICGRLPYGVMGLAHHSNCNDYNISITGGDIDLLLHQFINIKPYLRSMDSMTEEECKELGELPATIENVGETLPNVPYYIEVARPEQIDWLNKKMFDYRGLIPMGLALEAPEGMYN